MAYHLDAIHRSGRDAATEPRRRRDLVVIESPERSHGPFKTHRTGMIWNRLSHDTVSGNAPTAIREWEIAIRNIPPSDNFDLPALEAALRALNTSRSCRQPADALSLPYSERGDIPGRVRAPRDRR
jgi:hypothetical protein